MSKIKLTGDASGTGTLTIAAPNTNTDRTLTLPDGAGDLIYQDSSGNVTYTAPLAFTDGAEAMRIDSSGNLLVGKTSTGLGTTGIELRADNSAYFTASSAIPVFINRNTTVGDIVSFRSSNSTVGTITYSASAFQLKAQNGYTIINNSSSGYLEHLNSGYTGIPRTRPDTDNAYDLGDSGRRFDDIYATNGTINTSDRNDKQDIEELSEAEQRVAVACKGLLRKFRWKDAVTEKGDDARIHFGIIAQDLQDAFTAEGLDAGRYAMFISSTWWETTETYTDDDGVEQTRTNTYDTAEEAPEGATERTRLGVRYPELLAFIIAAI